MNIAIVSPNQNAYSETFIQAHRSLSGSIFYYYGGSIPTMLEGHGSLLPKPTIGSRIISYINRLFFEQKLNLNEKAFCKSLKKNRIHAILAEYGPVGAEILQSAQYLKLPLYVHFHGYDATVNSILQKYGDKYLEMFSYASKIFSVSNVMTQRLIELGCPLDKIKLNIYGPNEIFEKITPTYTKQKTFISIGRFVNKKAPYYTILAFKKVISKHPDAELYMAGEGELLETCKNLVSALNLQNNITFLGRIDPETYGNILSKVAGFIQHSITAANGDMEGTPVAILEASAAGLPVIATNHAGIPDVIIDNKTGYLVNEHDVEEMANKINLLLDFPEIGKKMGQAGKIRTRKEFNLSSHLSRIQDELELASKKVL